jgi:hypothetical protein
MSIHSSLFSFIVSSTPLLVVFISLLYVVSIFHHLLPISTFLSLHPCSSPFSLIPNFAPGINPPAALPFFFPPFAPFYSLGNNFSIFPSSVPLPMFLPDPDHSISFEHKSCKSKFQVMEQTSFYLVLFFKQISFDFSC